jgi:hypothetical protein
MTVGLDGSGHVQHLGGTVELQQLRLGGKTSTETAVYELDGGVLRIHGNVTDFGSGRSTLKLRGGTLALGDIDNVTVDELVFDGKVDGQTLTWNKRGKTFHVKDTMKMGMSSSGKSATFTLRRGTLRVDGDVTDGPDAGGLYLWGGSANISGSITVDELRIGNSSAGSNHTFTFSNNVTAHSMIQVGGGRIGVYNQQGGRVETTHLQLAGSKQAGRGTYNLDGGVLAVNGNVVDGGAGSSVLNVNGGSLEMGGDGTLQVDTLNYYGGAMRNVATIDAQFNHHGGIYSPGNSAGSVEIDGGYTMQPQALLSKTILNAR